MPRPGSDAAPCAAPVRHPGPAPTSRILFPLLGILIVAAIFRAYRIGTLFPILVDESIYLRWAEIIDHRGHWFISLLDAKQPLNFWIYAILRKALPDFDPLISARLVSVSAGLLSAACCFH